jgi:hypothetical protein
MKFKDRKCRDLVLSGYDQKEDFNGHKNGTEDFVKMWTVSLPGEQKSACQEECSSKDITT